MLKTRIWNVSLGSAFLAVCLLATTPAASAQSPTGQTSPSQAPNQTSPTAPGNPRSSDRINPPGTVPEISAPIKVDDKKFLKDAAIGGLTEVELGKLATQKASSDAVKQFGQKMVDDHSKANDQLKEVAQKAQMPVPDTLDSKHQAIVDKLAKLSGPEFDKAYMKNQVKDHQQDIRDFQNEANGGTNSDVRQFASTTLPVLQGHLEAAKAADKQAKSEGK
jgi:putative membrane protein